MPLLLNVVIEFPYYWQLNVEDYHLCIYSKLELHGFRNIPLWNSFILNCLGTVTYSPIRAVFSLFFFIYFMTFSDGYLIDHVYIPLAFDFWHVFLGIRYLAFGFWHLLLAYSFGFKKHFISISIVTFWHLDSTHTFKGARSLPEAVRVLTLGIQTQYSQSIRLHVHLLETCCQRDHVYCR